MKYDILESFKEYLLENMSPNTAKTYYVAVDKLFKSLQFTSLSQIEPDWLLTETKERFRTKSEYSAVKNGLLRLQQYDSSLRLPTEEQFREVSLKKRNFSKKPRKVIYLKPIQMKINRISDKKLKIAYRLALVSGLRVFELADLEASDIEFIENEIFVNVRNGKGGHGGRVECLHDDYLLEQLSVYLEEHPEGKLFYSAQHMKNYAGLHGFECHDLRRAFSIRLRDELKKEMPVTEANEIVMERMRHARFSTTKRYLFNRKLKMEYEKREENEGTDDKKTEKL